MEVSKTVYRTKQQQMILAYLRKTHGKHITVEEIYAHFAKTENPIGIATIYRQLEKLVSQGIVSKYIVDENTAACFSYVGEGCMDENSRHYHLKCENCGKLIHLECEHFSEMESHLLSEHGFSLDPRRTVLYGLCDSCKKENSRESEDE